MIYFLFILSIGLITILTLVIKRLQHQKLETSITRQKLEEANKKLKEADKKNIDSEQIHNDLITRDTLIRQLNNQVEALQDKQDKLQKINEEREQALTKLYDDIEIEIEDKIKEYKEEIKELKNINNQLSRDRKYKINNKYSEQDNYIKLKASEPDLYPKEKVEILLDILSSSINNVYQDSRRQHIIIDIINNNSSVYREEFKAEVQKLFRDYKSMNSRMKQALEHMGFEVISDNKNYKIVFHQDSRYIVCFAKTPSDWRAGRNIARDICNLIL